MTPGDGDDDPYYMPDDDLPMPTEVSTVDSSSVRAYNKNKREAKTREAETTAFWVEVFSTKIGRREMWGLLFEGTPTTHAFNTDFSVSPVGMPDGNAQWYRRGEQDFGLRLYHKWLSLTPETVLLMHAENDKRFVSPQTRTKRAGNAKSD